MWSPLLAGWLPTVAKLFPRPKANPKQQNPSHPKSQRLSLDLATRPPLLSLLILHCLAPFVHLAMEMGRYKQDIGSQPILSTALVYSL